MDSGTARRNLDLRSRRAARDVVGMRKPEQTDPLLLEQIAYYRAAAAEYKVDADAARELAAALDAFRPAGRVLELACGPGAWTALLLRHATHVTAVDAAPEMLARAKARVGE